MAKINFMGDVMLGELLENFRCGLRTTLEKSGMDPFEHVRPILKDGDLNVINLECVLSDSSALHDPFSKILIAAEKSVNFLSANKINIVTTANNHALDHGTKAFERSVGLMRSLGIQVIGYNESGFFQREPAVAEVSGRKIGFLGYNISNFPDADKRSVIDKIKTVTVEARKSVDTVVISMHWGEEYTNIPPPYVIEFGRELLDAGCDILHGHHSHQIQGVLQDGNKLFAPSLGNFIFDQKTNETQITAVLCVEIRDDGIAYEYMPCYMNDRYQPERTSAFDDYMMEINSYLSDSYSAGNEQRFEKIVAEKVKDGHRHNRIKMRMKMLGHFWDYLPYTRDILSFRVSKEKIFSVIECEGSLPDGGRSESS
jgi:poly-gamma-glutamate synthesis protein (capsule biosynthesis protein)